MATGAPTRTQQLERGIFLEYLTIFWSAIEGMVAVGSGVFSGSIALVGFGIDSFIETSSGGVVLWRLLAERGGEDAKKVERKALKLVGVSFLLLTAYVAFESIQSLVTRDKPERSLVGIGIAALSIVVMPWLARQKRKAAVPLQSAALRADSRQNSLCAYLSIILLAGLALNALFHWWWADPVAALVMTPLIAREGLQAMSGKSCDDCG